MAMKNIIVDEPPYEISGSGMPVVGRMPICIDTLISTWKMKNDDQADDQERASSVTRVLGERQRLDDQDRDRARARSTTPMKPHSSPRTAKMKSV